MARTYATATDYAAHAEESFDGSDEVLAKRLRSASIEVDALTRLAVYETDDAGIPTDTRVLDAFTEAVCAVVEHWEETGDPTGADTQAGAVKIGSVSLGTTSSAAGATSTIDKLKNRIGGKCFTILENAGLRSSTVYHL